MKPFGQAFRAEVGGTMAAVVLLLAGCGGIPAAALQLPPESSANRERQTRAFDGIAEPALLAASAAARPGFVIINNKAEGSAVRSVEALAREVVALGG